MLERRGTPREMAKAIKRDIIRIDEAKKIGIAKQVPNARRLLMKHTPVYTRDLRLSWKAGKTEHGDHMIRTTRGFGSLIEKGAPPHAVTEQGVRNLALWAEKQLNVPTSESYAVANSIARRIRREGVQPTFFVKKLLPRLTKNLANQIKRTVAALT